MISNRNLSILLLIAGSVGISFGGLIMRNISSADPWQIAFYRGLAFLFSITLVLFHQYRSEIVTKIKNSGFPGIAGGFLLMLANLLFIQALANTSIANALFTLSSIPFITAILAFLFLKEKISKLTLSSIILAMSGILLMVGNSLSPGQFFGNLVAFIMPISFAVLIIIIRKYPNVDMVPLQLFAGIVAMLIGYYVSSKITVSTNDLFLGFLAGFFQVGLGFIFITIGAKKTLSAMVGILMMTEAVLGPFWAWIFLDESPQLYAFVGGSIILFAVFIQFYSLLIKERKTK